MTTHLTDELLALATQAALNAGEMLRTAWKKPRQISEKGFRDLVTDADHASQALITELILSHFPDHGFLVEEEAANLPASGPVIWVIDPLDGTTNYSHQIPTYCVSIAAMKRPSSQPAPSGPEILIGAIYDPMRNELFQAAANQGATLNGRKIQVSTISSLEQAVIAYDLSHQPEKRQTTLNMLQKIAHNVHTLRAIGSAALALAWVAAGRLEGYFNLNLKPWDIAAGKLLIEEAGGHVETLNGAPWHVEDVGSFVDNGRVSLKQIVNLTLTQ